MKRYFTPKSKKVIFFDLNQTLIDRKQSNRNCFIHVLNEFTGRWHPGNESFQTEEVVNRYEKHWIKTKQMKNKQKLSTSKQQHNCLRFALKPYPIMTDDAFLQSFFRRMRQQQEHFTELYPEAKDVLTTLKEKYSLAIITNKSKVDLSRLNLSDLFEDKFIITPKRSKFRKPHPTIFKYAAKIMEIKPHQAVMVGNSWKYDIYGATRAGMDAVWIQLNNKKKKSQRKVGRERIVIIRKLDQLLEIF